VADTRTVQPEAVRAWSGKFRRNNFLDRLMVIRSEGPSPQLGFGWALALGQAGIDLKAFPVL